MRFFTSFYSVQNDNKLGLCGHLVEVVLRLRRKTTSTKSESIQKLVIPTRSEDSHKINRKVLIRNLEVKKSFINFLIYYSLPRFCHSGGVIWRFKFSKFYR